MTAPPGPAVRAVLVTGFLGAGKTTAIRRWIGERPPGERWAVLVNDFGPLGVDAAAFDGVDVVAVAGGCACCAAAAPLRVALGRLLRRARPQRLVIELSGLGHPSTLVDALREAGGAALQVDGVIAVVDASRPAPWLDPGANPAHRALGQAQLDAADVVLLNRATDGTAGAQALAGRLGDGPFGPRPVLAGTQPPGWAAVAAVIGSAGGVAGATGSRPDPADVAGAAGAAGTGLVAAGLPVGVAHGGDRWTRISGDGAVVAWRWPATTRFDRGALVRALPGASGQAGVLRAKGVFRTEREWYLWQQVGGQADWRPSGWRRDNRVECLFPSPPPAAALAQLEQRLVSAIR